MDFMDFTGKVALVGARIVTMADDAGGVIESGVVVINGNRIEAVGDAESRDRRLDDRHRR